MKYLIVVFLLMISISGMSQRKTIDTAKIIHQDFTEEQMNSLSDLLLLAKNSELLWNSAQITTGYARHVTKLADSLISLYSDQHYRWHINEIKQQEKLSITPLQHFEDSVKANKSKP